MRMARVSGSSPLARQIAGSDMAGRPGRPTEKSLLVGLEVIAAAFINLLLQSKLKPEHKRSSQTIDGFGSDASRGWQTAAVSWSAPGIRDQLSIRSGNFPTLAVKRTKSSMT